MTRPARRADRSYRCARCGHATTYRDAPAAQARYWFDKHSCQKQEQLMVKTVMAEIREAAIDRTPKPCLHKRANHRHGQRATYVLDRCRCIPCTKASSAAENERTRLKAYGRYHKYVDAYPVRLHLAELKAYGIGLKQVSRLSGVSNGSLTKIWYGLYADTGTGGGCNGEGNLVRGPSRRVLRSTAERIYTIEPVFTNLSAGAADRERTPTARIHLRSLVALGWSMSKLAQRLNMSPCNFAPVIYDGRTLSRRTVDKIENLFTELSMTLPPREGHRDKIAYSRARNYAKAAGWLPPLALDDLHVVSLEDNDTPTVDEAAIWRACDGDRTVTLTAAEKQEVVKNLHSRGYTNRQIAEMSGIKRNTAETIRRRLSLPANPATIDWTEYGERPRRKEAS